MVLLARGGGYEAHSHDGSVRFRRDEDGTFAVVGTDGVNPLANQSTDAFSPLADELAHRHPHRSDNAYPHAFEHVAQLFDHPAAPDLCVLHSASHNWEDHGGHRGEHGSLGIVQSRAPLIFAGKGVRTDGSIPRSARLVDIAPTLLTLLGVEPDADGHHLAGQDGVVLDEVLDPDRAPAPCRRVPLRRHEPERALRHGRERRGTERRPTHRDGHRVRATAPSPGSRPSRSRTTRR